MPSSSVGDRNNERTFEYFKVQTIAPTWGCPASDHQRYGICYFRGWAVFAHCPQRLQKNPAGTCYPAALSSPQAQNISRGTLLFTNIGPSRLGRSILVNTLP